MRYWILHSFIFLTSLGCLHAVNHEILVIVGAPGESSYAEGFEAAAEAWKKAAETADASIEIIGLKETPVSLDRDRIHEWIKNLDTDSAVPVWVVYVGHGTYNRRNAYLNLNGPDLAAKDLGEWLPTMNRTLIFVHGGSASSPFLKELAASNRILISATRNPDEINYARFGEYFAEVISDTDGDIDQDGQTSLLEAFLTTADRVESFYTETGRLCSEHSLIDDTGDALGTPPDWFRGIRVTKKTKGGQAPDGFRAHQIALIPSELEKNLTPEQKQQRDALETELESVRKRKDRLAEDDYYDMLEAILLKLSGIYLAEKNTKEMTSEKSDDS
jgi:hypothetical protein